MAKNDFGDFRKIDAGRPKKRHRKPGDVSFCRELVALLLYVVKTKLVCEF